MVTPSIGAVVTVRFPFSDLSDAKLRLAIVLAGSGRGDWVMCQITSNAYGDAGAIDLEDEDVEGGSLHLTSYVRPAKIFTANESLMNTQIGVLKLGSFRRVVGAVIQLLRSGLPI